MSGAPNMQEFPRPDGLLKWIWYAVPIAIVGVLLTPGKKAWREVAVMLFVAITLALFTAEIALQWGAGERLTVAVCAIAALIGRNLVVFFMSISQEVLTDEELRRDLAHFIKEWIKARVSKRRGGDGNA